jgi:hypothetical protein
MSTLHKEYHTLPEGAKTKDGKNEIRFTISFNRDRISWATSQPKKIGYQVTATPVATSKIGNGIVMEEFGAFTGFNDCLLEVDRQSAKRLQTAISILHERMDKYLLWFVKTEEVI